MKQQAQKKQASVQKNLVRSFEQEVRNVVEGDRKIISKVARKYLDAVTDPRSAQPTGIPTNVSYPGRSGAVKTKCAGEFSTSSTTGFGYVALLHPGQGGPYSDVPAGVATDSTFNASAIDQASASVGVNLLNWGNEVPTVPASSLDYTYRCVGMAVYVKPTAALLNQGGRLLGLEEPTHSSLGGRTFISLNGYRHARTVEAVSASMSSELVVHYTPKSGLVGHNGSPTNNPVTGINSPFQWKVATAAIGSTNASQNFPIAIVAQAPSSTSLSFAFEIYAVWELIGKQVRNKRHRAIDSRGMDLMMMALQSKEISGYILHNQDSTLVKSSYLSSILHWMKKKGEPLEEELLKRIGRVSGKALSAIGNFAGFAL